MHSMDISLLAGRSSRPVRPIWSSTISARPVCSHARYSNFFIPLGRQISTYVRRDSIGLGEIGALCPEFVMVVLYIAVDAIVGRGGDSEAPIDNHTIKNLEKGLPYLRIGRT